jgi:hypothetical protein
MGYHDPPDLITHSQYISTSGTLVAERFATASDYAGSLWTLAQNLLAQLGGVDFTIDWAGIELGTVSVGGLDSLNPSKPTTIPVSNIVTTSVEFPYSPPDPVEND